MADTPSLLGPTEYERKQRSTAIARTTMDILREEDQARARSAAQVLTTARQSTMTPDYAVTANRLRNTTAMPDGTILRDPGVIDELDARVRAQREIKFLTEHPRTAGLVSNYDTAIAVQDDLETIGWFESLGNAIKRRTDAAWDNLVLGKSVDVQTDLMEGARDAQLSLDELIQQKRDAIDARDADGVRAGRNARNSNQEDGQKDWGAEMTAQAQGLWRWVSTRSFLSKDTLAKAEEAIQEDIAGTLRTRGFEAQERALIWETPQWRQEIERQLSESSADTPWQGAVNILNVAKRHPGRFMQYMMEVGAESGVTIGLGVAVGAATKSPLAAATTMGMGSYIVSEGMYFDELVQSYGHDLTTNEGVKAFLEDPTVLSDLRDKSKAYGIVVGLLDGMSAGVAGKALVDNPVGEMVAQMLVQSALGGGGELLGRIAAGEQVDWNEVLLEAIAETVTAPFEVGGMALSGARRNVQRVTEQRQRTKLFEILSGKLEVSALRKRDRTTFQNAIAEVTKNGPAENIHIDPARMEEMFQDGDVSIKDFFEAVPELDYDAFIEARDSGSLYVIPTSVYAATIAGTETGAKLQDHLKIQPDDMTPAEAKTFQEDLAASQADLQANVDKLNTVMGELEGPLATAMETVTSEIVMASGFAPDIAAKQAAPLVAAARVGAIRSGMTVAEYLRRYTLPAVRNADTVGPAPARPLLDPTRVLEAVQSEDAAADATPGIAEIRDELDRMGVSPEVATRDDVIAAVKTLQENGTLDVDMPIEDKARPSSLEKADDDEYMQTVTLRNGEEDLAQWGLDPNQRIKVRDLAMRLEERQRKLYGKIGRARKGPKAIEKMAQWMADELQFELQTPGNSALGWYGPKFQKALDNLGALWAPLIDEKAAAKSKVPGIDTVADARALATAIFAVSSNGTDVTKNVDNAMRVILDLEDNGKLDGTGTHRAVINANIETLVAMAAEMGGAAMQAELTRQVTMSEVNAELRKEKKGTKGGYPADMTVPYAAKYLGPKLAAFYANLTGDEGYLTMDLWWTRSINRYRGDVLPRVIGLKGGVDSKGNPVGLNRFKHLIGRPDLTDKAALNLVTDYAETYAKKNWKNGTEAEKAANTIYKAAFKDLKEDPENAADRTFMIAVAQAAQAELERRTGVLHSIADIQALLWYYEKRLYADMGAKPSLDISYEEASQKVIDLHRRMHNGGPGTVELYQGPINPQQNKVKENTIMLDGKPVTLFHGTNQQFTTFKDGRIFLTNQRGLANQHALRGGTAGARVVEAQVALENPLEIETTEDPDIYWLNNTMSIERELASGGYDSVMISTPDGRLMVIATQDAQITQIDPSASDEFYQTAMPPAQRPVTIDDFQPDNLRNLDSDQLLELFKRPGWYVVTAARTEYGPSTSEANIARNMELKAQLEGMGRQVVQMNGVYKGEPDGLSFLVIGAQSEAEQLGMEWGQESILSNQGLVFTDGSGTANVPFSGAIYGHAARYEDFYSRIDGRPPIDSWALKLDFPKPADVTVDDGDHTSHYGATVEDGNIRLTHWSPEELVEVDPGYAGAGELPGPERKRGGPVKSFFGMDIGKKGGYQRENALLGRYRHEALVPAKDMYPWWQDPDGLKDKIDQKASKQDQMSQYESLIKAAGYMGYFVIDGPLGNTAALFDAVEVNRVSIDDLDVKANRSSEFVNWFKDSVVVNGDGSPKLVYHGTGADIAVFTTDRTGTYAWDAIGAFFTDRTDYAGGYGQTFDFETKTRSPGVIYPVYLSIQNPYVVKGNAGWDQLFYNVRRKASRGTNMAGDKNTPPPEGGYDMQAVHEYFRDSGYDGVIIEDFVGDEGVGGAEGAQTVYIAFEPNQIKSPFNRGTWDFDENDILFQSQWPTPDAPTAFDAWFEGSKVVDEDGKPIRVYHGSPNINEIDAFDPALIGGRDGGFFGNAFYFSPDEGMAWDFAEPDMLESGDGAGVGAYYLSLKNPFVFDLSTDEAFEDTLNRLEELGVPRRPDVYRATFNLVSEQPALFTKLAKAAGYDGVMVMQSSWQTDEGVELSEAAAFYPTQIKSVDNYGTYDPTDPRVMHQQKNGAIILPKDLTADATIKLFESANLSTMIHETGHFFLWNLQRMSNDRLEWATEELKMVTDWWMKNAAAIAAEAGVDQAQVEEYLTVGTTANGDVNRAIHTALHEQFARGFEAYAMEGKAPSNAMRTLFEDFAAWLLSWYKNIKNLNVNIDDDIRGVFDRLLATDEELLATAEREEINDVVAETARQMGLDEDSYRRLVALSQEARDEGRQLARKELLATEKKIRSAEYQARLAEIDAEERDKIMRKPVHRAIQWLAYGRWLGEDTPENLPLELRFDTEMLVEEFGKDILTELPRGRRPVYAKDTLLQADDVAGWFGFNSGAEMIDAMKKAPKFNDEVKAAVEARARNELGDISQDPDAVAQVTADAYHGEKRGQVIVAELRAINRIGGKGKMTTRQQAAAIARELIWRMPVREATQSSRYLAQERKHAEQAARALAAGDLTTAFNEKRLQLIQHAMYSESRKVAEVQGKVEKLAGKLKRKGTRENLAPEYLGAIDDILETYDFRKISGKAEARRERLQAYVNMMKAAGREAELAIPDYVLNNAKRVPYKTLTSQRLKGVYDTLRNIEHTARWKQKLRLAQEARELQEVRDEISLAFTENVKKSKINRVPTKKDAVVSGAKGYINLVRNADTLLRRIDGWASRGTMVKYFKQDIDDAGANAQVMREDMTRKMDDLFSVYSKGERRSMASRKTWRGYDQALSKWDIISIALNMGNKDNIERLTSKDSRGSFRQEEIDALVDNLDKRDWDFVQSVWDLLEAELWPLIRERELRATGVAPAKVDALPVQTKFGEYRGGYYPIVYDRRYSAKVNEDQNRDLMQDMMAGRFGKAQTKNGHTKERAKGGGGRTVQLGMGVLFGHVNHVIHDLAFGEAVNTTWKLLQDPEVKGLFEQYNMLEDHQALEWWVQDVAAGPAAGTHILSQTAKRMKSGFTLSKLAFNMSTVAIQVTGVTQSMSTIGSGYMLKGTLKYLTARHGRYAVAQEIKERSPFMAERETTFQRDAYDLAREVQLDPIGGVKQDVMKFMIQAGFFAMQKVQYYAVDVPTWIGAHTKGLDEGMSEADAARYADRMVARAQASGLYADRSAIERGTMGATARQNEFLRLFTALGSYMFAKYNVAEEVIGRTGKAIADPSQSSLMAILKGATDLVLLFAVEAVLYNLIKGTLPGMGDDDDEGWAQFLAKETALSVASVFPFVRDLSSAVQGFSGGGAYGGISETFGRGLSSLGDVATGEATASDIRSLSDAAGIMLPGYPSTAAWRLFDGAGFTGEEPSPLAVIMGR